MSRGVWGFLAAAVAVLAGTGVARADDSNRNEVRAALERGGWSVVWGKNFTEGDWVQGTKALAESIAAESPGPFLAWFGEAVDENFTKIARNLPGVAKRDLERWVVQSLKSKQIVRYKGFQIEAGFATYNRWQRVVYDEPRTREVWIQAGPIKTKGFEVYTERVEKRVPLPNWHQFYIRYKLVPAAGAQPGGAAPAPVQVRNQFRYEGGRFVQTGNGQWTEYRNNGPQSQFKETTRTAEYVELYDRGRDLFVRLYADVARAKGRDGQSFRPWPGSGGNWVR